MRYRLAIGCLLLLLCPAVAVAQGVPIAVDFFTLPNCEASADAQKNLDLLREEFGARALIKHCDLSQAICADKLRSYQDSGLVTADETPIIVIGGIATTDGKRLSVLRAGMRWAMSTQQPAKPTLPSSQPLPEHDPTVTPNPAYPAK